MPKKYTYTTNKQNMYDRLDTAGSTLTSDQEHLYKRYVERMRHEKKKPLPRQEWLKTVHKR